MPTPTRKSDRRRKQEQTAHGGNCTCSGSETEDPIGQAEIATGWAPYCGAAPLPGEWLMHWNLDPVLLLLLAFGVFASFRMAGGQQPRTALRYALACFAILFVSPFCALSSALFTARVVHHVILATVLAPLLAAAFPALCRRVPLSLSIWTAVQALVFWAWHAPPLYAAALSSDAVFWLMQASITASAAIWWQKLRQVPTAAAVAALLAAMVLMGVLGALITFAGRALYAPHWLTTQPWGMSPLQDQQIAGLIMWAPASAIYLLTAMVLLYRWIRSDDDVQATRA